MLDCLLAFLLAYLSPCHKNTIRNVAVSDFHLFQGWERGAVFVNGRNLGRYDALGPQRTLYIPRSFLKSGENVVIVFESGKPSDSYTIDTVSDLIWDDTVDFHI